MREISTALSDTIISVCTKIIESAKFDKTYKCRIVSKVSDNKYIIIKDNIEYTVTSIFPYNINDIVTVLLPQNNWNNALIVYPQNNINDVIRYTTQAHHITEGTLLDNILNNNTSMYFVVAPYYPEDIPVANEFAIWTVKQGNSRIQVFAMSYTGYTLYTRSIFSNQWYNDWISVNFSQGGNT